MQGVNARARVNAVPTLKRTHTSCSSLDGVALPVHSASSRPDRTVVMLVCQSSQTQARKHKCTPAISHIGTCQCMAYNTAGGLYRPAALPISLLQSKRSAPSSRPSWRAACRRAATYATGQLLRLTKAQHLVSNRWHRALSSMLRISGERLRQHPSLNSPRSPQTSPALGTLHPQSTGKPARAGAQR